MLSFKPSPAPSPNKDLAGVGFAVIVPCGDVSATLALAICQIKKKWNDFTGIVGAIQRAGFSGISIMSLSAVLAAMPCWVPISRIPTISSFACSAKSTAGNCEFCIANLWRTKVAAWRTEIPLEARLEQYPAVRSLTSLVGQQARQVAADWPVVGQCAPEQRPWCPWYKFPNTPNCSGSCLSCPRSCQSRTWRIRSCFGRSKTALASVLKEPLRQRARSAGSAAAKIDLFFPEKLFNSKNSVFLVWT